MNVNTVNRLYSGTIVAISGLTPTQMPDIELLNNITVIAPSSNLWSVYIGDSEMTTTDSFPLSPGAGISLNIDNFNLLYAMSDSGKSNNLSYIGS